MSLHLQKPGVGAERTEGCNKPITGNSELQRESAADLIFQEAVCRCDMGTGYRCLLADACMLWDTISYRNVLCDLLIQYLEFSPHFSVFLSILTSSTSSHCFDGGGKFSSHAAEPG
jgi:hypothetical protein